MAITDLTMPKMGESIMEATILKWHKKVGDHVKMDETVLDIATDKVDSEIPSPVAGVITEILYPVNNVVPVGSVIAKIETNVISQTAIPQPTPIKLATIQPEPLPVQHTTFEPTPLTVMPSNTNFEENIPFQPSTSTAYPTGNNRFFSPLVLNIANSEGISLSELERIPGTGADGRVSKKDVIQYVADKRAGKVGAFVPAQAPAQVVVQQPPVQSYQQPPVQVYQEPVIVPTPVQQVVMQKAADAPVYIAPQPIVEQPIIYPQPIVEPIVYSQPIVEPVIESQPSVESIVPQPIVEPIAPPVAEPVFVPQPIVEPVYVPEPIVESYQAPIIETVAPQPVFEPEIVPAPIVEAPVVEAPLPVVEPVFIPAPVVEAPLPIVEPVFVQQPIVEAIPEPIATPEIEAVEAPVYIAPVVEEPKYVAPPVVEAPKDLKPVYMVPPTTPSVPLVTLAEGDSGKYTSPTSAHPTGNVEIIEMDRMRKIISKHMVDSVHTSAHVTSFAEADVTNMVFWRERVKNDFEKREGTKITFTPMFIDCLVKVLKRYPILNASVEGDKIIIKKDLNIGMATALPTGNLIVPVIKGADQLNIVGLSSAVNKLANDARSNQLKPEDVSGGTFTLTNVGTFGTLMGTPIINQPQVAILAVGAIKKRPVVIESPNNDTIGIRHMMYLSLSYDHRIIDGSVGASFLNDVVKEFESWDLNRTWYHYL